MARDFSFLFWGLLFLFVDLDLGGFELLPDFIGYGLIAIGSGNLAQYSPSFRITRNYAWPLVVLFFLTYVTPPNLANPLNFITAILTILLIWSLLGSIIRYANDRERPDLAGHAVKYRRIYAAIAGITLVIHQAARFDPEGAVGFIGLAMAAMLAILAFILRLVYVVRHDLAVDAPIV